MCVLRNVMYALCVFVECEHVGWRVREHIVYIQHP